MPLFDLSVSSRRARTLGIVFAISSLIVACSSSSNGDDPSGPKDTDGSGKVPDADCASRCEAKVGDCGVEGSAAKSGCKTFCQSVTTDQLDCFESKSCDELEEASSLESICPAKDSGGKDPEPSGGSCDGKAFCKDAQTKAVCTVKQGVEYTETTECTIGSCSDGKCGACANDATCEGKTTFCYCNDGSNVVVELMGSCGSSGFCSISLPPGPFCQGLGGPDESRGDPVYHCAPFSRGD